MAEATCGGMAPVHMSRFKFRPQLLFKATVPFQAIFTDYWDFLARLSLVYNGVAYIRRCSSSS
jgi:hypothetical protein